MNDDSLLDEDNARFDFNEIPSQVEQTENPFIERPAGMGSAPSPKPQERQPEQQERQRVESRRYEVDGIGITVNYETLHPSEEAIKKREKREEDFKKRQIASELKSIDEKKPYKPAIPEGEPDQTVIFLPGWSLNAGTKSARKVGQAFADAGIRKVFVVDAKPDQVTDDILYKEAEAISRLIKESGIKRITISGHSEGGIRAVNLAVILQKQYPEIIVDGIVLMESVGLYDQENAVMFAANFAKDGIIDSQANMLKRQVSKREGISGSEIRTARLTMDVIFGTLKEFARSKGYKYPKRLRSQVKEMKGVQKHMSEVKAPVILIHGVNDLVSNPEKILPGYKDSEREAALRREFFPNSRYIRMVTGERLGTHAMPVYRAEQIAKDALYLLERSKREQFPAQPQPTSGDTV